MHDPGGAGGYLRSADRICIAVMLDKSECLAELYEGFFQIAIHYVGKYQSVGTKRFEITVASTPKDCAENVFLAQTKPSGPCPSVL